MFNVTVSKVCPTGHVSVQRTQHFHDSENGLTNVLSYQLFGKTKLEILFFFSLDGLPPLSFFED